MGVKIKYRNWHSDPPFTGHQTTLGNVHTIYVRFRITNAWHTSRVHTLGTDRKHSKRCNLLEPLNMHKQPH